MFVQYVCLLLVVYAIFVVFVEATCQNHRLHNTDTSHHGRSAPCSVIEAADFHRASPLRSSARKVPSTSAKHDAKNVQINTVL